MLASFQEALDAHLRGHRQPGNTGGAPAVRVLAFQPDGSLEVEVRFARGVAYCCAEPGCHLPLRFADWESIVNSVRDDSLRADLRRVRVQLCIEEGALLSVLASLGLPVASAA